MDGDEEHGPDRLLDAADEAAQAFASAYTGAVARLDAPGLVAAMRKLATIRDLVHRTTVYSELRFAADSATAANGALVQAVKERTTAIDTRLRFFELEWIALEAPLAERLLTGAGQALQFAAHHLRTLRARRPYTLSEAEERILAERRVTGEQAWARLYEERYSATEVQLDGERVPFSAALGQAMDPDRARRVAAVEAMVAATAPIGRERAYIYNTLIHDHAVEDRLRGFPTWLSSRNLENQIEDGAVAALVAAARARYDIPQRWYALKASLLGVERLRTYDLYAPLETEAPPISYARARDLVCSAYHDFAPEAGAIARRFFDEAWIDAPVRAGKMGGASCELGGEHVHPYVMLNHTGRRYDVVTMAHELGHGLHDVLAMPAGILHQHTPLTIAETASTFGEALVLQRLLDDADDDRARLGPLAEALEGSINTIFRQVALNQFEERAHTLRRSQGELSAGQLDQLHAEVLSEFQGEAVEEVAGAERHWAMIPHFFLWPGYVYAYAFGQLLSLSLYARYRAVGDAFVPQYLDMLRAGGSRSPKELCAIVGVDLEDPGFWATGLELVEAQLQAVETCAAV
ncbi:MAG: M3 family oligoendopeptidase [Solirubrobacteraceae bacterium]